MRRFGRLGFHVPPVAIADYVAKHGAVSLAEILFKFDIGETTLRRHRPALRQLGLEFVENGRWSYYARADLLTRSPTSSRPSRLPRGGERARKGCRALGCARLKDGSLGPWTADGCA